MWGEVFPHLPSTTYQESQQSKVGWSTSPRTTYDLPSATYHLPDTNHFSFQQHSRFQGVTTFVFFNIPASLCATEIRSFVFIAIPSSSAQKRKFLFTVGRPS